MSDNGGRDDGEDRESAGRAGETPRGGSPGNPTRPPGLTIEERLTAVERAVGELATSVRTRHLEVVDEHDRPRIVAEVVEGQAELRVALAHPQVGGDASVLVYAAPDPGDVGAAVGVQLWAAGDAVAELNAWPYDGRWRAGLHLEDGEP